MKRHDHFGFVHDILARLGEGEVRLGEVAHVLVLDHDEHPFVVGETTFGLFVCETEEDGVTGVGKFLFVQHNALSIIILSNSDFPNDHPTK